MFVLAVLGLKTVIIIVTLWIGKFEKTYNIIIFMEFANNIAETRRPRKERTD